MGAILRCGQNQEHVWNGGTGEANNRESGGRNSMRLGQGSFHIRASRLTFLAVMGFTLCADIPDEVFDQIKKLGTPNMVPAKQSPNFPKKGQRQASNFLGN